MSKLPIHSHKPQPRDRMVHRAETRVARDANKIKSRVAVKPITSRSMLHHD